MTEKKKKRYPADRQKLHALLDRREQELLELQEEVEDLRGLVKQADRTAIHATAELPKDVTSASAKADTPAKLPDEEVMDDDDDA